MYNPLQPKIMIFSVALHILVFAGFSVGNPFSGPQKRELEVVRVKLTSQAAPQVEQKTQVKPPPKKKVVKPKKKKTPPKKQTRKEKVQPSKEKKAEAVIEESEPEEFSSADMDTTEFSPVSNSEMRIIVEGPGFDDPDWGFQAKMKVERNRRNYVISPEVLICTIYFRVLKSGRIYGAKIAESSGNAIYDRSCLQAVQRSSPLPPLPVNFAHEEIGVFMPMPAKATR